MDYLINNSLIHHAIYLCTVHLQLAFVEGCFIHNKSKDLKKQNLKTPDLCFKSCLHTHYIALTVVSQRDILF